MPIQGVKMFVGFVFVLTANNIAESGNMSEWLS